MIKRSKKDRSVPPAAPALEALTPSTVLKVGETFLVLRRAPNKEGVTDERCLATVVEIRDGEESTTSTFVTEQVSVYLLILSALDPVGVVHLEIMHFACFKMMLLLSLWKFPYKI